MSHLAVENPIYCVSQTERNVWRVLAGQEDLGDRSRDGMPIGTVPLRGRDVWEAEPLAALVVSVRAEAVVRPRDAVLSDRSATTWLRRQNP